MRPALRSRSRRALAGALFATVLLGAGCATTDGSGPSASGPRSAGSNLVGEACTVDSRASGTDVLHVVHCGSWEQPSARILERQAAPAQLASLLETGPWRGDLDTRMRCGPARATSLATALPGRLLDCTLLNGNFPTLALGAAGSDRVFLADGIPAALPVIERVVLARLGRAELGAATAESQAIAMIKAQSGRPLAGADSFAAYFDALASGQYYDTVADFGRSEAEYRKALLVEDKVFGAGASTNPDVVMTLALEISNQGRYAEAAELFDKAGVLARQSIDPGDEPRLLSYRAIDAANRNALAEALGNAQEATRLRRAIVEREVGSAPQPGLGASDILSYGSSSAASLVIEVAQSLHMEAAILLRQGRLAEAAAAADQAIAIARGNRAAPPWWLAQFLETRATIARIAGDAAGAVSYQSEAVRNWAAILPQSTPEGLARLALGRALYAQGNITDSLAAYRAGLALLKGRNADVRPAALIDFLDVADRAAAADPAKRDALALEMFEAAQIARSGYTSRTVSLATARLAGGSQEIGNVIRQTQENERRRFALASQLNRVLAVQPELRDEHQAERLRRDLATAEAEAAQLDQTTQAAFAGYRQVLATPLETAALQGLLRPDEAVLAILAGDRVSYGFLVRHDRLRVWRIAAGDLDFGDAVSGLRRSMGQSKGRLKRFDLGLAHQLYTLLLGPAADDLSGVTHLVMTVNGALASLPFAVLVASPPAPGQSYGEADWLVRHYALTLVPSVRSFADLRRATPPRRAAKPLIGFGDFRPDGSPKAAFAGLPASCARDLETLGTLAPLPGTAAELRGIAGQLGGASALVLGAGFTKTAVEQAPLSDYRVVYFATHGVLASDLRCFTEPALVTSASGSDGGSPLLGAGEILDLRLNADLVVLSACNTGGGDGKSGGEALSGLARAFFYAGARRLVVSHWSVPDAATATLMRRLFAADLAGGADALRQAQLSMLGEAGHGTPADWAHPWYWGGFTIVGDGSGVTLH